MITLLLLFTFPTLTLSLCRTTCNNIPIHYPFGIDDGCGAPPYRNMLNCSTTNTTTSLFFLTPSGSYNLQSINYPKQTLTLYDPTMSTCSILQPHHDFLLSPTQSLLTPPSPDTVFALVNCSLDSPILNHYKSLCFNFSGHSCNELYDACTAFRVFNTTQPPACCFTGYDTVKYMSMNILDCTHYAPVYNVDELKGMGPVDWVYGIKLSFVMPETGCSRCEKSGGTCGFDVETEGMTCICSATSNSTRQCVGGSLADSSEKSHSSEYLKPYVLGLGAVLLMFL